MFIEHMCSLEKGSVLIIPCAIKSGSQLWFMAYTCSCNINECNSKKTGLLDLKQEDVTVFYKDFIRLLTFLLTEFSL